MGKRSLSTSYKRNTKNVVTGNIRVLKKVFDNIEYIMYNALAYVM